MLIDVPLRQMAFDLAARAFAKPPTSASYDGLLASGPRERTLRDTGWELPSPFVAAPGRSDLTLADIAVIPDPPPDGATRIPEVQPFDLNDSCTLRRPRADEVVRNVRLDDTARYTQIHMFSKPELADAVVKRIEGITRHAKHYKTAAIAPGRMGQVDVFVTDTSAPVYLVLQTFDRDVLWNIHLADGARLSHVAMIGNKVGLAAPPGGFTFEALRIGDFVEEHQMYDTAEFRPCMVAPWRNTEPDWPLLQKLEHPIDAKAYQQQLQTIRQGHAAFNTWYTGQLGVEADTNLTSAIRAAHALSGPVPPTPLAMVPLQERVLHVAHSDYIAFDEAQLQALHDDLLLAATGGDLSILTPAPMEATQP